MKLFLKYIVNCFILLCYCNNLKADFVINEILPAPVNNEPEWVEIYNNSADTKYFSGGYINDAVGAKKISDFVLPPHYYIIMTKDSNDFLSNWIKSDSCLILQTSMPTFNNDHDMVVIRNSDSTVIDSVYYNMKFGYKGISLERINPNIPVLDFDNLKSCISSDSATPGKWNSVSVPKKDVSIELVEQNSDSIKLRILNNNDFDIILDSFLFYFDLNNDGFYSQNELTSSFYNIQLYSNEIYEINYSINDFHSIINLVGKIYYKAEVKIQNDDDTTNDIVESYCHKKVPENSIVINEFLFEPKDNQAEFVELFNLSTKDIVLNDFLLHNSYKNGKYDSLILIRPTPILKGGDYIAVVWDSVFYNQFPELLNSTKSIYSKSSINLNYYEDTIVLQFGNGIIIDSVSYKKSWHNRDIDETKGKSLEKINPHLLSGNINSWTTSLDFKGCTPGFENSVYKEQLLIGDLTAEPNPFSPSGSSKETHCLIKYDLPFDKAKVDIRIYNQNGNIVRSLVNNYNSEKQSIFTWDGFNDEGFKLDIGAYVLIIDAKNVNGNEYQNKILIVIAE